MIRLQQPVFYAPWIVLAAVALVLHAPADSRAATPGQILQAVKQGRAYLQRQQAANGTWRYGGHQVGATALCGMALVETGSTAADEDIRNALQVVRSKTGNNGNTYDISLAIMFLDRAKQKEDTPLIRELAGRLVAGQMQNGSWSYSNPLQPNSRQKRRGGGGDNSNTQFAVLALWVARRHGADVDEALKLAGDYFRQTYHTGTNGWGYRAKSSATPPMTCAGLIGIAAAYGSQSQAKASLAAPAAPKPGRGPLKPDVIEPGKDPLVRDALEYLGNTMQADRNDRQKSNLYFLWSLERVAVIYGLPRIGATDWHDWGATYLVKTQADDGSWNQQYGREVSTSLALLFLNRANVASDLTLLVSQTMRMAAGLNIQDLADRARAAAARNGEEWKTSEAAALLEEFKKRTPRNRRIEIINLLEKGKGATFSAALASALAEAPADLKDIARAAYANRMTRMTARTLISRANSQDGETRLAITIAAGRKRSQETIPTLIALLLDRDARVGAAAHASLQAITGQNFAASTDSFSGRFVAQKKWKEWWAAQQKK